MKIFIQIPCFNEELQIANTISEIKKSLDINEYNYEIVIIVIISIISIYIIWFIVSFVMMYL